MPPLHATQNTLGVQQQQVETGFNFSVDSCVVWCVAGLNLGQGAVCVCGVRVFCVFVVYVHAYIGIYMCMTIEL